MRRKMQIVSVGGFEYEAMRKGTELELKLLKCSLKHEGSQLIKSYCITAVGE